jgi:hypothetical protein
MRFDKVESLPPLKKTNNMKAQINELLKIMHKLLEKMMQLHCWLNPYLETKTPTKPCLMSLRAELIMMCWKRAKLLKTIKIQKA